MSDIFDYTGKTEKEALSSVRKNQETFAKEYGPKQITEKTKDITNCFHPEGKTGFQGIWAMAGWTEAVKRNVNSFKPLSKKAAISPEQFGMAENAGGMIVFSSDVNSYQLSENEAENAKQQQYLTDFQRSFAEGIAEGLVKDFVSEYNKEGQGYTFGKGFTGHYVDKKGNAFDENSATLELTGIPSNELIKLAENIAWAFFQETVLVKDYNNGKVYLVDGRVSENPEDYDPNKSKALENQNKEEKVEESITENTTETTDNTDEQ